MLVWAACLPGAAFGLQKSRLQFPFVFSTTWEICSPLETNFNTLKSSRSHSGGTFLGVGTPSGPICYDLLLLCSFRHNIKMIASTSIKPVVWTGNTRVDLASFPEDVKDAIGYALYIAQRGGKHPEAKPLRGFGGAGILEIMEDHAGVLIAPCTRSAWRVAYMSYMCFRRNQRAGSRRRRRRLS
jgi:phage-related protein